MINQIAPFIGMGIVVVGIILIYLVGVRGQKKPKKKTTIIIPPGCERSLQNHKK